MVSVRGETPMKNKCSLSETSNAERRTPNIGGIAPSALKFRRRRRATDAFPLTPALSLGERVNFCRASPKFDSLELYPALSGFTFLKRAVCLIAIVAAGIFSARSQQPALKLWYRQPAGTNWNAALPVGNGRLGAMVFGGIEKE